MSGSGGGAVPWILAIDTGTSEIVVAAGDPAGGLVDVLSEPAGHRHGERLLAVVEQLLARTGLERRGLEGIVVGTGPGAFTGLRVGLATAKTLAHGMSVRLVGIGTGAALVDAAVRERGAGAAGGPIVLFLPAGPRDRVILAPGASPRILGDEAELASFDPSGIVAVDLADRAAPDAVARGRAAHRRLGESLLVLGAERLRAGFADDPEQLVPEYVTLPRGVAASTGAIEWSNDPR